MANLSNSWNLIEEMQKKADKGELYELFNTNY